MTPESKELMENPTQNSMSLLAIRLALQRLAHASRQFSNTLQDVLEEIDRELAQGKVPPSEALLGKTVLFRRGSQRHRGEVVRLFSDGWVEVHEGEKVFSIRPDSIEEVEE